MALHEKLTSLAKDAATKANSLAKDAASKANTAIENGKLSLCHFLGPPSGVVLRRRVPTEKNRKRPSSCGALSGH